MKNYFLYIKVIILHQSHQELLKNINIKYIMSLDSFIYFSAKKSIKNKTLLIYFLLEFRL